VNFQPVRGALVAVVVRGSNPGADLLPADGLGVEWGIRTTGLLPRLCCNVCTTGGPPARCSRGLRSGRGRGCG